MDQEAAAKTALNYLTKEKGATYNLKILWIHFFSIDEMREVFMKLNRVLDSSYRESWRVKISFTSKDNQKKIVSISVDNESGACCFNDAL